MIGPRTRDAFEAALKRLVGRSLRSVAYHENAYDNAPEPRWSERSTSFDSLDDGVALHLDDGNVVSFMWGWEFAQYNVSVWDGEPQFENAQRWDVGERWHALGLLGPTIISASALWLPSAVWAIPDPDSPDEYPQDVRLAFDTDRVVVISAFEQSGDGLRIGARDHITVFFDEAEARRLVPGGDSPR